MSDPKQALESEPPGADQTEQTELGTDRDDGENRRLRPSLRSRRVKQGDDGQLIFRL